MKIRSSTKIGIGFAALVALAWGGYNVVTDRMIMNQKFSVIAPGDVNIVGIDAGAGYRIIVANQIAQLVEASEEFQGNEQGDSGATEGAIKRRLPIRELLQSLQGNEKSLAQFVMAVNDIREGDDWPAQRIVWKAEDIRKALDGNRLLASKLESDLNVKLDGTPLPGVRISALQNGIIIDTPVTVRVNVGGETRPLVARVQEPYRPRISKSLETRLENKSYDQATLVGYYTEMAREQIDDPKSREDVRKSLESRINASLGEERAQNPDRVLRSAKVVLNENFIESARYATVEGPDGKKRFNLTVNLTDEGRRRLWQYSKRRIGTQLLLVANGIAIAAPRIQHQLAQGEITITQMPDEVLVRDAVEMINAKKAGAKP